MVDYSSDVDPSMIPVGVFLMHGWMGGCPISKQSLREIRSISLSFFVFLSLFFEVFVLFDCFFFVCVCGLERNGMVSCRVAIMVTSSPRSSAYE